MSTSVTHNQKSFGLYRIGRGLLATLKSAVPYLFVAILFSALAIPLVLTPRKLTWSSLDELAYHYVTIRQFHSQWPHLDLRDYPSPQTPLYHVILAAVSQVNDNLITLRLVSFAISLAAVLVIEAYLMSRARPKLALFFTILIAVSPYFLGTSIRLLTDNLALGPAIAALFALDDTVNNGDGMNSFYSAFLGAIAVLTRQIYLWLAPMQFLATFIHKGWSRNQQLLNVLLSAVPFVVLVPFILMWHGLAPLSWTGWSNAAAPSVNPDVPIFIVSLLGVLGSVFILTISRAWLVSGCRMIIAALFAGLGMLTLLIRPFAIARGGWLFAVARLSPSIFGTALVYWILFPLGLVYLYILAARQLASGSYFILIAFALWIIVNSISAVVFQRYYEPMLIFFLAYILAPLDFESPLEWLIPSVYFLGFLGLDVMIFYANSLQSS